MAPGRPRTGVAVTRPHGGGAKLDGAAGSDGIAEKERGTARSIDLVAVMHFQDLDVELLAEGRSDAADQGSEKIDADAHIARPDDAGVAGGRDERRIVLRLEPGGAEHMHDAGLRGEGGQLQRGGRAGEIDDRIDAGQQGRRVGGDRDADRTDAGERAHIGADHR